jgi:hypothetical protein
LAGTDEGAAPLRQRILIFLLAHVGVRRAANAVLTRE